METGYPHSGEAFYLTAPIYYPSANLHLGNTYTSIVCDAVRRYKRELGYDVYYVTGSDEHGEKLERAAKSAGMEPKEYIDPIVASIKELWEMLDVVPDSFVRTSDPQHMKNVQKLFQKLYDKGDIYKDTYQGYYCTPCEEFWTEAQLEDGNCPSCGRPAEYREEESYFFRLSKYQDQLLQYYEDHPNFILPPNRKKELLGSFFKRGLQDLSVTRSKDQLDWGVPVPFDPDHVIYVWIDALISYLTGIGLGVDQEKFDHYWPAAVHFIGRDIVRFHAIIWPAVLMALEIPLPDQVFAHGWILFEEDKMSKSKGNVVYPEALVHRYGRDAVKYFVLREFNFGSDGNFSTRKFINRLNADLANDLGNLLSRTTAMVDKYFDGKVPAPGDLEEVDQDLMKVQTGTLAQVDKDLETYQFQLALESIWTLIRRANKYIDETEPWILVKENKERLATVLYRLMDALRAIADLLLPFMPETAEEIFKQIGLEKGRMLDAKEVDLYPTSSQVHRGDPLFPRLDLDKELEAIQAENNQLVVERTGISLEELEAKQAGTDEESKETKEGEEKKPGPKEEKIPFEDFLKVKLRVGEIVDCKVHPNADRLLVETVDFGDEKRTIVSGIREYYKPEDLIGKQFIFVVNLEARTIRGIESDGMILTAEEKSGKICLVSPVEKVEKGSYLG